eukprot:scaffold1537_cov162-Ochromonas_danica.AAC.24
MMRLGKLLLVQTLVLNEWKGEGINRCQRYLASAAARHSKNGPLVGFATDLEGDYHYWQRYVDHSTVLYHDKVDGQVKLRDRSIFVYGGDVCDRGDGDIRILQDLLHLKKEHPDRVYFIMGNRDINKLRLPFSLSQHSLEKEASVYWLRTTQDQQTAQSEVSRRCTASKLKWILSRTMGAPQAFEFRRRELEQLLGHPASDEEVSNSFLDMIRPSPKPGLLLQYLKQAQVALLLGDTLFLHGALHDYNRGWVPGDERETVYEQAETITDPRQWIDRLNSFARREIEDYCANCDRYIKAIESSNNKDAIIWEESGGYGHAQPGSRLLQYGMGWLPDRQQNPSVIYSSYLSAGQANPPNITAAQWLVENNIHQLIVGHQPHGDAPWPITLLQNQLRILCADTAYSRNTQWPQSYLNSLNLNSHVDHDGKRHDDQMGHEHLHKQEDVKFLSVADHLQQSAPPLHSTRSEMAVVEVLVSFPPESNLVTLLSGDRREEGELLVRGRLSDGSTFHYAMPQNPSSSSRLLGRPMPGEWFVKASHIHPLRGDGRKDLFLVSHSEGFSFRNRLMTEDEIQGELAHSRHQSDSSASR